MQPLAPPAADARLDAGAELGALAAGGDMGGPLGASDRESARRLRSMKLAATAALAFAAVVYALSFLGSGNAVEFVRAGAEAAMVGGLADWFAVTALFRHPLGLPVPHTALVPRKKDELATKLGEFVTGHFLTSAIVVEQVREADVVGRIGRWLAEPGNGERLAGEAAYNAAAVLDALDEDAVVEWVLELVRRDQARRSWAPLLGQLLARAVEGGTQRPFVDVLAARGSTWLRSNTDELMPPVKEFLERRSWVVGLFLSDKRVRAAIEDAAQTLEEVERDPQHPLRLSLERLLRGIASELQNDPATAAKLDGAVLHLLEDPHAVGVLHDLVHDAVGSVRASLQDADGALQLRLADLVRSLGARAVEDPAFRERAERAIEATVGHGVDRYGNELTALIRTQVGRWDATSASRRIELAVGRDLQFIRINGTAVGALAGIVIHALTVAF